MSGLRTVRSTCRSCGAACSVLVTMDADRVVSVRPDPDGPVNHGTMCPKGLAAVELLYHPDRLRVPMKRIGARGEGKWQEITWEEAFDILVREITRIRETYGAEAISLVQGTGRHHLKHTIRFANALGTPNWYEPGAAQCYFPRVCAGQLTYGAEAGAAYLPDAEPECILFWGSNPSESSSGPRSLMHLKQTLPNTELIVVDPRRTKLAERAKYHLQLRPGTDAALALCFMNVMIREELYDRAFVETWCYGFDELKERCKPYTPERVAAITWVPAELIEEAARYFAKAKPATVEWGCALEHTPNAFQTIRAVAMLPCLTGNYDVPGGWVENMPLMPTPDTLNEVLPEEQRGKRLGREQFPLLSSNEENGCPTAHIPTLYHAALTGEPYPVKALLLFGNNSLMEVADSQKAREVFSKMDFISCMDLFMTPTAEMADLVLPAATWLEYDHICGGAGLAGSAVMCVKKLTQVGQCRPDEEVFCELARRLGLDYRAESVYDIMNAQLAHISAQYPEFEGLDFEAMRERTWLQVPPEYFKYRKRGGFRTPTGKVELWSTTMERLGLDPLPSFAEPPESPYSTPELAQRYPLILITGARRRQYFASEGRYLRQLRKQAPFPLVSIHPETAKRYGIADGDWVFIENARGKITQKAFLTDAVDPRVIHCEMGWYYPEAGAPAYGWTESNVNLLTNQAPPYDENSGTYQLNALLCGISKNPDRSIEDRWRAWQEASAAQ